MLRTKDEIHRHLKQVLGIQENNEASTQNGAGEPEDNISEPAMDDEEDIVDLNHEENIAQDYNMADVQKLYNEVKDDSRIHDPFIQGTKIFTDSNFSVYVKSVAHQKSNRYELSDHLYKLTIEQKNADPPALLLDIEDPLREGIIHILNKLKEVYNSANHHQVYLTIIEKNILNGLNSGNYSLNAPSKKIANWVCSMLYNYLKSKQTLTLNESFNVKIKVLGVRHILDLLNNNKRKKSFKPHIVYH